MEKMEARAFGGPQRKTRPETQKWLCSNQRR